MPFRKILITIVASFSLLSVGSTAVAEAAKTAEFVQGTHYKLLPITVETRNADQVEVVELFSYACIHCFNFDPLIESWHRRQDDGVDFYRTHAVFNADWELLAQAFYTAETLGVTAQVHTPLFESLHVRNEDVRKPAVLTPMFEDLAEVSAADFTTAYNSFSVRSRVQQAKAKVRAYQVTGVPSIIVNGKYRVDGRMAGGNAKMLEVVDYLINLEQDDS